MKFSCPKCAQHLEADDEMAGVSAQCPSCATQLTIPEQQRIPPVIPMDSPVPSSGSIVAAPPPLLIHPPIPPVIQSNNNQISTMRCSSCAREIIPADALFCHCGHRTGNAYYQRTKFPYGCPSCKSGCSKRKQKAALTFRRFPATYHCSSCGIDWTVDWGKFDYSWIGKFKSGGKVYYYTSDCKHCSGKQSVYQLGATGGETCYQCDHETRGEELTY